MTDSQKLDAYFEAQTKWKQKMKTLRDIFKNTELKEALKWGKPTYTLNGKTVVVMADFKNHLALWFHQGVFLKDLHKKLINAQEGITKAQRQWRFNAEDVIDPLQVLEYVNEAIANTKAGKLLKPEPKKKRAIPELLEKSFSKDSALKACFQNLSPGKQREFAEYIGEAKREETRQKRLKKCIALIKNGTGLYNQYKK